ncbi:MAG: glucose-6-phosphate dehydrogenase [Acidobacteria bacterium]|nr:MAG: glucose-6-phosphate dehydrogenase [Acidobacteriota bacterium]
MTTGHADALILFGITGNLARTRLFPALYALASSGDLNMPVIGVSKTEGDDAGLRRRAEEALVEVGIEVDPSVFRRFASGLCYVSGDYRDPATYDTIKHRLGDITMTVSYLAIPPDLFDDVVVGLAGAGLASDGRLVVEKPFGRDTASATELNQIIHRHYPEPRVFRIDHFLGKDAVQNLMVYRFSNTILEPVWNRHYIRGVQITMAEDFGVEGRGAFYDSVGALRDVVQNHLIQLISLLAMEPPVSDEPDALRDERVKVLKATKTLSPQDIVRGQYAGYHDEPGVESGSDTETFFAARFEIDSWRWAGVPWVIRAGKGLASTVTEAVVEFNRPPRMLFAGANSVPGANRIAFRSKPEDRVILSMQAKRPGPEMVSEPVDFVLEHEDDVEPGRGPYYRLLGDALGGDSSLFAREDGVMESWRILQPVLDDHPKAISYPRGTWGPPEADSLLGDEWEWITNGDS